MVRSKIPGYDALNDEAKRVRAAATKVPEWKTIMDEESKHRDALAAKQRAARIAREKAAAAERVATPASPRAGARKRAKS